MESVRDKIRMPLLGTYSNVCSQKNANAKSFISDKLWAKIYDDVFDSSSQISLETDIQIWAMVIKMINYENTQ